MRNIVNKTFAQIVRDKKRHKRVVALLCALSILVATGVFTELTQPVITMTPDPICGIAAHSHGESCYKRQLTCALAEDETHAHTEKCYQSALACGMAEHKHGEGCYPTQIVEEPVVLSSVAEASQAPVETQQPIATVEPSVEPAAPINEVTEDQTEVGSADATVAPTATMMVDASASPEASAEPAATAVATASVEPVATVEATVAVEPTVTVEPTATVEAAAPVIHSLNALAASVRVGQTATWKLEVSGATELTYELFDANSNKVDIGLTKTDTGLISWMADREGVFTLKVSVANENGTVDANASVTVLAESKLHVAATGAKNSAFAGESVAFGFVCEGEEAASVSIVIKQDDNELYSADAFAETVSVTPEEVGKRVSEITATITATDALGESVSDSVTILCAVRDAETENEWRRSARTALGEDWRENLIAVAKTQLGYKESELDFIIDDDGVMHGYTRYGHWYGARYSEWCAMFASFCLNYAEIPQSYFPREANCNNWVSTLKQLGLYQKASEAEPAVGDLVFFDYENDGRADHVGIVSAVNAGKIEVIEGNVGKAVRTRSYDLKDDAKTLLGYGDLTKAYEQYLADHAEDATEAERQTGVVSQATLALDAPVYAEAYADSEIIVYLTMGTVVDVLPDEQNTVGSFYLISVDDIQGYVSVDSFETEEEIVNTDNYDVLMSELEAISETEYAEAEIEAFIERCDVAYECGNLSEEDYIDLIATARALLGDGTMTLENTVVSDEISKVTPYDSNGKTGYEFSVKFIPVDSDGNVLSDIVAPNNTRYYFDYATWGVSSYSVPAKKVVSKLSEISDAITSEEVVDIDLINMSTGAKAFDANYVKLWNNNFQCGATDNVTVAVTGTKNQDVYMAVYYTPVTFTLTFVDDNGENLATTTAFRGGLANVPSIENYAVNTVNSEGKYLTGWQTANGTVYGTGIYNVQSDLTLKPYWSDTALGKYAVTFSYGDGQSEEVSAYVGQRFGELVAPDAEKEGYRFDGWFDAEGAEYTAATVISASVTLTAKYTKYITVSFNINNSNYTNDPGSGNSHVAVASTEGLSTDGFTYTKVGTGNGYRVSGTGTIISFSIPSGESLSDSGLSLFKISVENQVENGGTSNNTYTYVSPYSWIDSNNRVCTADTVFAGDTDLYLRLYANDEHYSLNFVCCEDCASSIDYVLSENGVSYPNATFAVGESVSAEYILSASDVNAYYTCATCTACGRNNQKVLDYWYILDQSGKEVKFTAGTELKDTYLPTTGNAVKVYAKWKEAPSTVSVTFYDANYSRLYADGEAANFSTLGEIKPADPSLSGCTFVGWAYKDGDGTILADTTVISADSEFIAVYQVPVTVRTPDLANGDLTTYSETVYYVYTGHTLADALDANGNAISAAAFVNGYFFNNSYTCSNNVGSETVSNLADYSWYPSALTLTPDYALGVKLTFRYSIEEGETVTVATYYTKMNGMLSNAVDADGNPVSGAPALSVPGYTFNNWKINGTRPIGSYDTFYEDTVFIASLTPMLKVEFMEKDFADVDADGVTDEFVATKTVYLAVAGALSTAVDAQGVALAELPTGANGNGSRFLGWTLNDADVTLDTQISENAQLFAKYETAPVVTFNYRGTSYAYTVESGVKFADVLALATNDTANPLPLETITANQSIEVDGEAVMHRFAGWSYPVAGADLNYDSLIAADDLQITADIVFTASYTPIEAHAVILHDVNPDGDDYEGISFDLLVPDGESLADHLKDLTLVDGTDAVQVQWYSLANGERTRVVPTDPVTQDLELYTYSYRLVLVLNAAPDTASTSLLDALIPSAQAATITIEPNGEMICIDVRDGEKLKPSDLVINGVDYSMYTVTVNGNPVKLSDYVGNALTKNIVATNLTLESDTAKGTKDVDMYFYVFVDGKRVSATGENPVSMTLYQLEDPQSSTSDYFRYTSTTYYLTPGQLEWVYRQWGVDSNALTDAQFKLQFANSTSASGQITSAKSDGSKNLIGYVFVDYSSSWLDDIPTSYNHWYYLPKNTSTISSKSYSNYATSNTFWSINVSDPNHYVYAEGEDLPPVSYVLTGNTAKVTVVTGIWTVDGADAANVTTQVNAGDGTTTYTITNVTEKITLTAARPLNTYAISYDINIDASVQTVSERPTIEGEATFSEVFELEQDEDGNYTGNYIIKTPTAIRYTTTGSNCLISNVFDGWMVNYTVGDNVNTATLLQPGDVLNADQLALYAQEDGSITLTGKWTNLGTTNSVSFYVQLALQVVDFDGSSVATPDSNYTKAFYGTQVTIDPQPTQGQFSSNSGSSGKVIEGNSEAATAETDRIIRSLVKGYDGTYAGATRKFTLLSFPNDESMLAQIRSEQSTYVAAYNAWLASNPGKSAKDYATSGTTSNPRRIIYDPNTGEYIPVSELISANYTVRWYVFKYEATNGWHVDGVLVKRQGQLTVTKTFYGDADAIAEVKKNYSITVTNSKSESIYTLNLNEKTDTNTNGYTHKDDATDTYTWVIPLTQGATYKLTENNYQYASTDGSIATIAEYMVTNSYIQGDNVARKTYEGPVSVIARAYETDLSYSNYKTVKFYNSYIPKNTTLISKVDDSGHPLSGVKFNLQKDGKDVDLYLGENGKYYVFEPAGEDIDYEAVDYITTDSLGYAQVVGLDDENYYGNYSLVEVEAPEGYTKISAIDFTVGANGITGLNHPFATVINNREIRVMNTADTVDVTVTKVWAANDVNADKEVKATLCLNGAPIAQYEVALNEGNRWTHTWENVPAYVGGALADYTVRETWIGDTAYSHDYTDGYESYNVVVSQPTNSYDDNGKLTNIAFTVYNSTSTGNVYFSKVNENGDPLSGATFATYTLYSNDELSQQVGTATSAASGQVSFGTLPVGTYYMKETAAPNGYATDENVYKVVVTTSGSTITRLNDEENSDIKTIANYPEAAEITIKKVDANGNPLSGATFQIKKDGAAYNYNNGSTSNITGAGTADGQKIKVEAGTYTIVETVAPTGYYGMSGSITFTVENGSISNVTYPNEYVTWDAATNTFTVKNVPGVELPSTGGVGTLHYTIGGLLLMATSLLLGISLRRKRERRGMR